MSSATRELKLFWLSVFLVVGGIDIAVCSPTTQAQNSHVEPVTSVIDGVAFEGD